MAPTVVLIVSFSLLRLAGVPAIPALRIALSLMFLLAASAHWGRRRPDLVRMVPPALPRPDLLVTLTGILELLGAAGLLIPATAPAAALCLAILLVALFPANVYAARAQLRIAGQRVPPLAIRLPMQLLFIGALLAVFFYSSSASTR